MKSFKHFVSSIVTVSALLGLLTGSQIAQATSPKFDRVTITYTKCVKCTGRGYTHPTTVNPHRRNYTPTDDGWVMPCRACGGTPGSKGVVGSGKQPPTAVEYLVPRGSTRVDDKDPDTEVKIEPAKVTQPKTRNR